MLVVIDANVICSALLAKGKTSDIIFSGKIKLIAPELIFIELEKHRLELLEKSKLSGEDFNILFSLLKSKIEIISSEEFKEYLFKSNELLKGHEKDTEYVALAIKYDCPLWSKEKRLKRLKDVKVLDADEVAGLIKL